MTSEVQQTYYGWQHGELSEQEDTQGPISISQVIGHGSISFGRFSIESLSWEKRSVFTHNERLEELEKFKSPGLVAKKRAYFEEYYKKIRALKAMQNQQTELSLEYGADGSISSQAGDDDEPALPSTKPDKIPESICQAPLDDLSVEVSFEQECSEASEHVGPGSLEDSTGTEIIELYNDKNQQISGNEPGLHGLFAGSSEEIKLTEGNHVKLTFKNDTKSKMQPDATSVVCLTDSTISDVVESYFVPVDNHFVLKEMLSSRKSKEGPVTAPVSKEPAASARYFSKTVNTSISERTKASLGSKRLLQKATDKAEIDVTSSKKTIYKTRSRDKLPFLASQRSPTELQNEVDVRRPVSVCNERKRVIDSDSRNLILRSSNFSTRSASGQYNAKGNLRLLGDSREMATQISVKNRVLQSKSIGHGGFEKNMENMLKTSERRTTTEHLKSRSINLPSKNNPDPNRAISCQSGSSSRGDKSKKTSSTTASRYEVKGSKPVTTFQQSGNIKFDSAKKQLTTSQRHELTSGARKSSIGGKNSRQENPRWR